MGRPFKRTSQSDIYIDKFANSLHVTLIVTGFGIPFGLSSDAIRLRKADTCDHPLRRLKYINHKTHWLI
jgi:hypothetical protein